MQFIKCFAGVLSYVRTGNPRNVLAHSWLTAVTTCFEQFHTFEGESFVRCHENVTRTIYLADFCDFTVTTTRRKALPFATSVDSESLRKFVGDDVLQMSCSRPFLIVLLV